MRGTKTVGKTGMDGQNLETISAYCAQAVVKGYPYFLDYDGTNSFKAVTCATHTFPVKTIVALEAAASGAKADFATSGEIVSANVADGVAIGDHLEVINTGTSFIVDGTTTSTSRTVRSVAIAMAANASGAVALKSILLFKETTTNAAT